MEAKFVQTLKALTLVTVLFVFSTQTQAASSARSRNFIVSAPSKALAEEIAQTAERYRRELAVSWLGKELPPWQEPCPIRAKVDHRLGAGGATSFLFETGQRQEYARPTGDGLFRARPRGRAFGWEMTIQGSRERILDSVLPHEVTHTIFATHFGRPLPRWADEGACTTVEHVSEKKKQDRMLQEFLTTERGIPFNQMFAMTEYPDDILPLYSQGYSLARYLIQQGGRRKFIQYVGEALDSNAWVACTKKHYGYESISDLQVTWLQWVGNGSRKLPATPADSTPTLLAANEQRGGQRRRPNRSFAPQVQPRNAVAATQNSSPGENQSWYVRQRNNPASPNSEALRDLAMGLRRREQPMRPDTNFPALGAAPSAKTGLRRQTSRPNPAARSREVLLEWGRPSPFLNPRLAPHQEKHGLPR